MKCTWMSSIHSVLKVLYPLQLNGTTTFLPPANEVWGKVMFLHLSVILFTGEGGGVSASRSGVHPPGHTLIQTELERAETNWLA